MNNPLSNMQVRDLQSVLHPYTNLHKIKETGSLVISEGKGVEVFDAHGRGYIEGMSGLWCAGGRRHLDFIRLAAEAVHPKRPLQPDQGALDAGQQEEAHQDDHRAPDGGVNPHRRRIGRLNRHQRADDDVAGDQHREVGWCVIGAVVMQFLPTRRTALVNLEIAAVDFAFAAGRAVLTEAAQYRLLHVAIACGGDCRTGSCLFDHVSLAGCLARRDVVLFAGWLSCRPARWRKPRDHLPRIAPRTRWPWPALSRRSG